MELAPNFSQFAFLLFHFLLEIVGYMISEAARNLFGHKLIKFFGYMVLDCNYDQSVTV